MDKIKRFIECLVPVTNCNLKCNYCYVIHQKRRNTNVSGFNFTPDEIADALRKERLGGICYISMTGAGETLLPCEVVPIVGALLNEGHYINITTNGTLNTRFDELLEVSKDYSERLHISFSLHYLELIRIGKLDDFFNNIKKMRNAGCSILLQLNLNDEYIEFLDEINELCVLRTGAKPHLALTRDQRNNEITIMSNLTLDEYKSVGDKNNSKLFECTIDNFMVKRHEFCYAGDWSFQLYLGTGIIKKCYDSVSSQNIFENPNNPIKFSAVGNNCLSPYCVNSSHFMTLGIIPELETKTYFECRDRPGANWYSSKMKSFLNSKLCEANKEYSLLEKIIRNKVERSQIIAYKVKMRLVKSYKRKLGNQ